MQQDNDDFMDAIKTLRDDPAPEDLYQRIMTVAPHMPQLPPDVAATKPMAWWHPYRLFGDWEAALVFKCAVFAVLAYTGVMVGQVSPQGETDVMVLTSIIDGRLGWEDWT